MFFSRDIIDKKFTISKIKVIKMKRKKKEVQVIQKKVLVIIQLQIYKS